MTNSELQEGNSNGKDIPVRVAVRIRPMVPREINEACQQAVDTIGNSPQVHLQSIDKAFTFDYAFNTRATQGDVYEASIAKVVKQLFQGYNVTVLAYGQTGSGKTHSMGTNYTPGQSDLETGIIPRAVQDIFDQVDDSADLEVLVKVSFIELYKETLYDLLNQNRREETIVDIREDPRGGIKICGLTELPVLSVEETMKCLEIGALNRVTGATAMNAHSSRSHAIFSLHLELKNKQTNSLICSKFHMVDLAGSERCKKTRATGERLREGININKGLLALGNVISALCVEGNKSHVPYRDSKLTRLLQDSLGGNSHTLMLACVSPADSNLEETLSTLRYADRARKIKNKPIVNRNPQEAELALLRSQVQQLQVQLLGVQAGNTTPSQASSEEVKSLLSENCALLNENEKLTRALQTALDENVNMAEKALMAEAARDKLKTKLEELKAQTGCTVDFLNKTLDIPINPQFEEQLNLVKDLQKRVIELQCDQSRSQKMIVDHDLTRHNISAEEEKKDANENDEDSPTKEEFGVAYTLRQAKLNEQLQDINRALAMKEELMSKMTTNDDTYLSMKTRYEKHLKDLEDQVNGLLKEKNQLQQLLKSTSHAASNSASAEQKRKRLQELESSIAGFKRKILEQNKLIKMKEQSEQQVLKMNADIQNMKATRVKLLRQMKEDSEKFRKWKAQKDREVAKLKQEDRKKQNQIVKMERLHNKQQIVLKRKMEEAVAINKRFKEAMNRQRDYHDRKAGSKETGSLQSRVKSWLKGELELVAVREEAKQSLPNLLEDRKRISNQLTKTIETLTGEFLTEDYRKTLIEKKKKLENDLQLRSAQITDIQTKLVDEDIDVLNRKRFDGLQSMVEVKYAAQHLFHVATHNLSQQRNKQCEIEVLSSQYEEACQNIDELEAELRQLKEKHQLEMDGMQREHEDKILFLLNQMPGTSNDGGGCSSAQEERLLFQEKELQRLSKLHEQLQAKRQECEDLKKIIESNNQLVKEKPKSALKRVVTEVPVESSSDESDVDEELEMAEDDDEKKTDPDWRKTPLFQRIQQFSKKPKRKENLDATFDMNISVKRNSQGDVMCGCSKNCATKLCKCRKSGGACTVACKCNALSCVNRSTPNSTLSDSTNWCGETLLSSSYEVGSKGEQPKKRIRFSAKNSADENLDPLKLGVVSFDTTRSRHQLPLLD